ncbi:AIPR family protein [Pedobacter sp. ASV1-7]|uniref:AIPR family protein n=1 Tax=Pedobacter sp. ASV1-7 TaxID=3145237 RepID=UPI0032E90A55
MAKNDSVLIDGILDDRILQKLPSEKRDEAFEYFAIEQIMKDFDLTTDEVLAGLVDGKNDGGIDGFYILVNGHLVTDPNSFFWPKSNSDLEVFVITCKHGDTFKQAPLDNIAASLTEIFDFGVEDKDLKGDYNDKLLKQRGWLVAAYRRLAHKLNSFSVKIIYASRGDSSDVGESIKSRGNQIVKITKQSFGACNAEFIFCGSSDLVDLSRKVPNFSLELPFIEVLAKGERYVLLSKLSDYYNFIIDESSKLRRYLFDSNVRAYMGLNRVNEDIKATLEDNDSPDFWWLNNGVTILATSAQVIGKTIHIEDIQIVNGLQTTESIYKHFQSGLRDYNERSVLVKILVSNDLTIRDSIIRATNNQTIVELSALHATDKIQRDIEDVLLRHGIYYERRTNYYASQGIVSTLIVTPLYIAAGFLSLILRRPKRAPLLKSKFMRNEQSYEEVFSEKTPLEIWPIIAKILIKTDEVLELHRPTGKYSNDGFLKRYRHIVSFLTVSKLFGKYNYGVQELLKFDVNLFTSDQITETYLFIKSSNLIGNNSKRDNLNSNIYEKAAIKFNIEGIEILSLPIKTPFIKRRIIELDKAFLEEVNNLLPDQPWPKGTKNEVAYKLNVAVSTVNKAINILIQQGVRSRQKNNQIL